VSEEIQTRRRRLLQGAAGGALLLAGCLGNEDSSDDPGDGDESNGEDDDPDNGDDGDPDDGDDGDDPEGPGDGERQAGVVARLDPEAQQAVQQLQIQAQQGEIDQEEFEAAFAELLEPILEALSGTIEADTAGRVVETLPELGAARVNGPPEALLDVVELDDVDALVASGDLDFEEPAP